jgi:hypothetical protein
VRITYRKKNYIIAIAFSVILTTALAFVPFENVFVTFSSAESAYRYINIDSVPKKVIEGQSSGLIIGENKDSSILLILPKTTEGWKTTTGKDTRIVKQKIVDDVIIYIYQYKKTPDYYIVVKNAQGGHLDISDSVDSDFVSVERWNNTFETNFISYYSYVQNFDENYKISVNGKEISFV